MRNVRELRPFLARFDTRSLSPLSFSAQTCGTAHAQKSLSGGDLRACQIEQFATPFAEAIQLENVALHLLSSCTQVVLEPQYANATNLERLTGLAKAVLMLTAIAAVACSAVRFA